MKSILRNRVFVCGVLSPLVGIFLYVVVYSTLTSLSSNLENDWVCRLVISTFAMIIPNLFTFALAVKQSQQKSISILSKVGVMRRFSRWGCPCFVREGDIKTYKSEQRPSYDS